VRHIEPLKSVQELELLVGASECVEPLLLRVINQRGAEGLPLVSHHREFRRLAIKQVDFFAGSHGEVRVVVASDDDQRIVPDVHSAVASRLLHVGEYALDHFIGVQSHNHVD